MNAKCDYANYYANYYAKAVALVADMLEQLDPNEFEGRRMKIVAVLRNAANAFDTAPSRLSEERSANEV